MPNIYWGDIHNHNQIGYAEGTLERSFAIAENSLDFYSFTPHGWWPDIPGNDRGVQQYHEEGFARVESQWDEVLTAIESRNRPGGFVTIPGWEWHSVTWGDYCVYFYGDRPEIYNVASLEELKRFAADSRALLIPHHPGYRLGWRGLDWKSLDPVLSPVVEILSEHGNSLEPGGVPGMYGHSMGGIERSQSGLVQLRRGRRFGFVANSDDHFGYPGGHGLGLTAVYADTLDRESILGALTQRHSYAVTGDRIRVHVNANGGVPGDVVGGTERMQLDIAVEGRDRLHTIEVFKNSESWRLFGPQDIRSAGRRDGRNNRHRTRIEWGWDKLESDSLTTWRILITADNSRFADLSTEFCGGAGSVEKLNLISCTTDQRIEIDSFTSRRNTRPVSSISLDWLGPMESRLQISISGSNAGTPFQGSVSAGKRELLEQDVYLSALDKFSSPKLKVHSLIDPAEFEFETSVVDENAQAGDYYFIKVTQQNGQMAWTSPVWIEKGASAE